MQERTIKMLSLAFFLTLLLWGVTTLIVYVGVPVHGAVLTSGATQEMLRTACSGGSYLCRGAVSFFPFITYTFGRAAPFAAYAVVCIVLAGLFIGWKVLRTGSSALRLTLQPWKILGFFLLSLWLLFTVLSFQKIGEYPMRMLFEPLPQVYDGIGEEGLAELQENFHALESRGCLNQIGTTQNGAKVFMLRPFCMQGSFVTRVLPQVLWVLVILFEFLVLGRAVMHVFRVKPTELLRESLLSLALGACAWIVILWLLAVMHVFIGPIGWLLILGVPLAFFRHSLYWLQKCFRGAWTVERPWYDIRFLLAWLLLSYFALNFLNVLRPFPIGWDDLGSYLNRPRLLVSYGHFVFSMSPFQWEYLTSLGFLLFGFNSFFGATASMMINWLAGLLATGVVFVFANTFLGKGRGLLASLLYYSLPLVGHFSYADMKIDNAAFGMAVLSLFCLFLYLFPRTENSESAGTDVRGEKSLLILAGLFGGFSFAMKSTSIMVLMAAGVTLVGTSLFLPGFLGAFFVVLFLLGAKGILSVANITERITYGTFVLGKIPFLIIAFLAAACAFGYAYVRHRPAFVRLFGEAGIFVLAFLGAIAPWIIHNNLLIGNIIPKFETGAPNTLTPTIVISGNRSEVNDYGQDIRVLPPELKLDMNHATCTPTGTKEELDRYWGAGQGLRHYVTLPWRTVMNMNSGGYYVTTMPALLLFPLLLLLPFFWMRRARWLRWLCISTIFILLQWMFLANGIAWYGLGMFLGLLIGLEALLAYAPDVQSKVAVSVLLAFSLFVTFNNRFWQHDQQKNLFEYAFGKITASALRERTIPHYDDIAEVIVQRHTGIPDRPYAYRVGTFIPYFVPKNLEVIGIADHQLDTFNCLYQERNPELTLKRLKALGFNSVIFDTNTATIEDNMQGTLHQKVQAFVDFLNNPTLGLQVLVNDADSGVAFLLIP